VVGWTDLTAPGVADRLAELAAPELVGVRHLVQDEPDPSWLTRPEVQAGLAAVGAAGLAYDLLVTPAQLPATLETVRRQPGVRFVLDHGAKPPIRDVILQPWGRLIADLAAAPNVAVKLSGLVTEAPAHPGPADLRPYCDRLLSAFGPDRVMFGSDWPVCLLACDYDRVVELAESACTGLSAAERASVFGGTAARWYAIEQVEICLPAEGDEMAAPLIDQAIEHLRDLIVRGDLEPGSKLPPEQDLAVMLGCSRGTAREAVRSLVMARVLDVRRGDGTYVTSLRPELLLEGIGFAVDLMRDESLPELWEVRMLLEPAATAKAAETISDGRLAELTEILDQMRRSVDDEAGLVHHDARFHELVAAAAGNSTIASLLGSMSSRTLRARVWRGIREAGVSEATVRQHAEILHALQAHDPKMAHAAAVLHIGASQAWFRRNAYAERQLSLPAAPGPPGPPGPPEPSKPLEPRARSRSRRNDH
jgi:GntR family transcriptional repressor for pyruvate dehydrogenase complex